MIDERREFYAGIGMGIVLTLITCGIYNLFWNYKQMRACNHMLGREEFNFAKWFLLTLITCGIYHVFYQYSMGQAIVEIQRNRHMPVFDSLPILSTLVTIIGLPFVIDAIHQSELNKLFQP